MYVLKKLTGQWIQLLLNGFKILIYKFLDYFTKTAFKKSKIRKFWTFSTFLGSSFVAVFFKETEFNLPKNANGRTTSFVVGRF